MFEKVIHAHKIRKLQAAKRRLDSRYRQLAQNAEKAADASRVDIDELYGEWSNESRWGDDEILQLNSNFLRDEAERLFVRVPQWSTDRDKFEQSEITDKWRLTQAAQADLRKAIRLERKEAAEQWLMWVPIMSLLVALMSLGEAILATVMHH